MMNKQRMCGHRTWVCFSFLAALANCSKNGSEQSGDDDDDSNASVAELSPTATVLPTSDSAPVTTTPLANPTVAVAVPDPPYIVKAANWRGNAAGAYSIIHDDLCSVASLDNGKAAELLGARDLKAAFGAIVGSCGELWAAIEELDDGDHEIINHSWDHTDHVAAPEFEIQIDLAHDELALNLGKEAEFYIFPFDSSDASARDYVRNLGYLGARGGVRGLINEPDFEDDFELNFDVFGPGYSAYCVEGVCAEEGFPCCYADPDLCTSSIGIANLQGSPTCKGEILQAYVDEAISGQGWAIREFHGVDDGWEPVPQDTYETHLDYVEELVDAGRLWVDIPSEVIRYRRTRQFCTAEVVGSTLTFGTLSAECLRYVTPLTLLVSGSAVSSTLSATQNGRELEMTALDSGMYGFEVDPERGDVIFGD